MVYFLKQFKKAAHQNAAFFIFINLFALCVYAKPLVETFESVRARATTALLQKQKKQALQMISEYVKNETNKNLINEANEFLVKVAQTFMSKEAQEAYETSVNLTVENPKAAIKQAEECLQLEPQNIDCLVQRLRLAIRAKNAGEIESNFQSIKEIAFGTKLEQWITLTSKKADPDFKNKTILKKINEKPTEDFFVLATLELDRCFSAKNFSRAKDVLLSLERTFPDWPDLIFYKQKIETESAEEKKDHAAESLALYVAKCKNLSKSIARKYRYDFDLCQRGSL